MPKFRDWVAGRTAVTIADNDELYVRDDDANDSKRITWGNVKAALGSVFPTSATLTTDGDILTRATGVPARITRADLAADSAWGDLYVSRSSALRLWVPAGGFTLAEGAPSGTLATPSAWSAWLLDASSQEGIVTNQFFPSWWSTFSASLYWTNNGAGSGAVRWELVYKSRADTEDLSSATGAVAATEDITAPAQNVLKVSPLISGVTNDSTKLWQFRLRRIAANPGDTLANDAGVLGILFTGA